ncbi:MAG: insulinase family protein [Blastocatellia bacterium]|nr:insulinase family protein [Blastocatellia bacterium]
MNRLILPTCILLFSFCPYHIAASEQGQGESNGRAQTAGTVLPIVKRDSLLNGLRLIVIEQKGTGSVSAGLRINSGALFDLAGKGGLADITAGMLLRGGGGLDAESLRNTVEDAGLTVNITVGWDSTDIVLSGPSSALDTIFDLLSRLLINPKFDSKELEALKAARIAALKEEEKGDAEIARRKALEAVFGTHPFGRPARGTAETISRIKREDLTYYHGRFYLANNAELVITGDVTADQITRLGRTLLGAWKKGETVPATFRPPAPLMAGRSIILDRPDAMRARAAIAQIGISRRADDYFATAVMGELLAGVNSQIASATIKTGMDPRILPGSLLIEIESSPDDLAGAIEAVIAAMSELQTRSPALDRVEAAKSKIISGFQERLRTNEGAADAILDVELYGLGRDYMLNFVDRVNAVTPSDVQQAAKDHLKPQALAVVVAGPSSKLESALKKNGPVTVMP